MKPPRVILGAPGCGKTRRLLDHFKREVEEGVPSDRIAFVAFTRAAAQEAQSRLRRDLALGEIKAPWVRTIHSASFQLLAAR